MDEISTLQNNSIDSDNFQGHEDNLNEPVPQTIDKIDSDILCILTSIIDQTCNPTDKLLPARDRRIEDDHYLPDYEVNKSAAQKYQLWDLYWNRSQTPLSITAHDDYVVKTVVKSLVDTIDTYEKQERNKIDTIFGIRDQRHISNFSRHNPDAARKRILNKYNKRENNKRKRRYSYIISSDSDGEDIINTPSKSVPKKRGRKPKNFDDQNSIHYDKLPKRLKQGSEDEEDVDPTFKIQSSIKTPTKLNIRRSTRFSRNSLDQEIPLVDLESDNELDVDKLKSNPKISKKSNKDDFPTSSKSLKMFEEVKRRNVRNRLELGIKLSTLKQRMGAKETVIGDLREKYEFINNMQEKLDIERAKMNAEMSLATQQRDKALAERDEINTVKIQLQNENTRIRKINVQLQNTIINLDKKVRDKMVTFERLGLDGDDTFGRFNPYSTTTKLDARKNRQRMLFNCADVIAAGTIDDGISLVADLHKDLQLDPSVKEVARGHPVLAELNKFKQKKVNPTASNVQINTTENTTANLPKVVQSIAKPKKQSSQPPKMLVPSEITLN